MNESFQNSFISKGSILIDQGRYKDAEKIFKDGLSQNPSDGMLLYYLALAQYHLEDKQALQTINEAIKQRSDEPFFYNLKSLILLNQNKPKLALEVVEESLRLDPEYAHTLATKACVFLNMENWKEAERFAKDALALDADNNFAANILANSLSMQNKLDESTQLVSDMLAKDPDDSVSHSSTGWVYLRRKDYAKAQIHFRESLRLDPNFEPARTGMLETLRAKSAFYRLYLQYSFFLQRQNPNVRIAIFIGIYFFYRFVIKSLQGLLHGPFAALAAVAIVVLIALIFGTWVTQGIANLIILFDQYARYSLKRTEKLEAVFVGGFFLGGILLFLLSALLKTPFLAIAGMAMGLSAIPFSITFTNGHQWGRIFYGGIAGFIILSGLTAAIGVGLYGKEAPMAIKTIFGIAVILFILSSWLGAFRFLRK